MRNDDFHWNVFLLTMASAWVLGHLLDWRDRRRARKQEKKKGDGGT